MKKRISITLTILGLTLGLGLFRLWPPATTAGDSLPALQGEAALNHLKERRLYASLHEAVAAAPYGFYQEPKQSEDWLADNPAQRLRARFTPEGLQVEAEGDGAQSHRLGMKLRGAGYGERQIATSAGRLTAEGPRAEIRHELRQSPISNFKSPDPGLKPQITEWYVNTAAGLEQGFTLESAPGERRDGEWLRVSLTLEGDLRAEAVDSGQALEFKDDAGRRALRYDHLAVKDAGGRKLEARMALGEEEGEVWLEVDDRDAMWPVTIDPTFIQQQKIIASDVAASGVFGWSVAISGATVVVSASGIIEQGAAYIFVRSGGVWIQQQKLMSPDVGSGGRFGSSVAICGETVVVGAFLNDGAAGADQGSAYVFTRNSGVWTLQQKLEASDAAAGDGFGYSLAISGETVMVGAQGDDGPAGREQGSAYVFTRSGGVWTQQQKLIASDAAAKDNFGYSIAISGETVVVGTQGGHGANGVAKGSAYVFTRSCGVWTQQQKLIASNAEALGNFGLSVAISGETVVVGAPFEGPAVGINQGAAYVFTRSGGVWTLQRKLEASDAGGDDGFGSSVAISGETVVVGAFLNDGAAGFDQGSAYVFARSGGVWTQRQKLIASDPRRGDHFGISIAISGETIVAGAEEDGDEISQQGFACIFAPPNTPPTITATAVSRRQGVPASSGAVAAVNDAEDRVNTLNVTVNGSESATVNGVTVSSINVNSLGQVMAGVGAACNASNASFTLSVADSFGLVAEATLNVTVTPETTPPVITCPSNVVVTLPPDSMGSGMAVNYPAPTATDNCTASPIITTSKASGSIFPVGVTTVNVMARDAANNQATCGFTVTVLYNFDGFFPPIDNAPAVNVVNAGRAIPVKFSLGGNKGVDVFAPGYPASQQISCSGGAPVGPVEPLDLADGGLSQGSDKKYNFNWKTEKSWEGTCRQLIVKLNDGSEHVAFFKFE
jgi:hypothetical protein